MAPKDYMPRWPRFGGRHTLEAEEGPLAESKHLRRAERKTLKTEGVADLRPLHFHLAR